jgi:excisionase family DNA binding protein
MAARKRARSRARSGQREAASIEAGASGAERMLSRKEVARLLGVHPETIRRKEIAAGLPCHRIGRQMRFFWAEVKAWVGEKTQRTEDGGRRAAGTFNIQQPTSNIQ